METNTSTRQLRKRHGRQANSIDDKKNVTGKKLAKLRKAKVSSNKIETKITDLNAKCQEAIFQYFDA